MNMNRRDFLLAILTLLASLAASAMSAMGLPSGSVSRDTIASSPFASAKLWIAGVSTLLDPPTRGDWYGPRAEADPVIRDFVLLGWQECGTSFGGGCGRFGVPRYITYKLCAPPGTPAPSYMGPYPK